MDVPALDWTSKSSNAWWPEADMAVKNGTTNLLGNSIWNAIAFVVAVALNLVILPFVVFRLGVAAFGVAGLVTACVAPALAFSNALALSTTRELALRLEPSERDAARRMFATAAMLALVAGGAIVILFGLAGAPLARLGFHLSGPSADDLGLAFALASAGWLCQCLSAVFLALFTARQDYRRVASISIVSTVVATSSMLLFIPRWPQASTFLGCQALGFATSLLLAFAMVPTCHRRLAGAPGDRSRGARSPGQAGELATGRARRRAHCRAGGSLLARSFTAAAVRRLLYDCAAAGGGRVYRCPEGRRNTLPVLQRSAKGG